MKRTFIYIAIYIVILLIGIPASLFGIGSLTGSHFVSYDDEGTWVCWRGTSSVGTDCWFAAPIVPSSYVKEYKRGWIGCQDGLVFIKNVTLDATGFGGPGPMVTIGSKCGDVPPSCKRDLFGALPDYDRCPFAIRMD